MKTYQFRNCFLNTFERHVIKDGKHLEMTSRTFDVLQFLVERAGEIVSKDEMLGSVWDGSFVEEGNLAVHISKLRRLLGETNSVRFIETVQGTGYRFISPVRSVDNDEWRQDLSANGHLERRGTSGGFVLDSIAMLPLRNESNNPELDYLADGLTESFINSLSRIPDLRVIARDTVFRYKNKDADAKEVGETLGVTAVLSGRIKVIKDRLMISVELIRVEDGSQLWGKQFSESFSDIIKIQEEILRAVSEKLRSEIKGVVATSAFKSGTRDPESYRLYLKGKYFQEKRTEAGLYKGIECFQKSISYDPTNVYSYVEAIESYSTLYFFDYISYADILTKIKPFLFALQKLNQSIDVVQAMYGGIRMYLEWRFNESEKHLKHALSINPNCLIARYRYSDFLGISGRLSEALEELYKVLLIDPFSPLTYKRIGRTFWKGGQFDDALLYLEDALEMEPCDYEGLVLLGAVLTELGRYDEALDAFQQSMGIHENADTLSMMGCGYARGGRKDEALQIVERMKPGPKDDYNKHAIKLARIYVALRENETAYEYLDEAYNRHEVDLTALSFDPRWASIRDEPRFREIVRRVGLPEIKPGKYFSSAMQH